MPPKKRTTTKRKRQDSDDEDKPVIVLSDDDEPATPSKKRKTSHSSQNSQGSQTTAATNVDTLALKPLYEHYKKLDNESEDKIGLNGIMQLIQDLGLSPEGIEALVVLFKFQSKMSGMTRSEFWNGFGTFRYCAIFT